MTLMLGSMQALAARGEPLLSGFETAPADFAAYWRPHGWAVTELLDGRCGGSMLACEAACYHVRYMEVTVSVHYPLHHPHIRRHMNVL